MLFLQLPAPSEVLDEFAIVVLPLTEAPDECATPAPAQLPPSSRVDG